MSKRRKVIVGIFIGAVALVVIVAAAAGPLMSRVEQPKYEVTSAEGSIELREYSAMILPKVEVKGERKATINEGFRLIAAYIFGANEPNAKISMTAPVQQQAKQTIAMMAPVAQQADGGYWTVSFIMPKGWSMDTLPAPTNKRVKLVPVPAKRMVVIRFSGTADDRSIATKTAELRKYAADHTLSVIGEPALAFYNPPWTLPFLRRNEIILGLAAA
jgi:hypothetical protein